MAIEKSMNPAPMGIMSGVQDAEPIEIEIENPDSVDIRAGGLEIILQKQDAISDDFNANLAELIDDKVLQSLSSELLGEFQSDLDSRKDWIQTYVDGLELLGMKLEDRSEPWEGACGVTHPLLAEALVKFQSETIMDTFPAQGPVKTQIIG